MQVFANGWHHLQEFGEVLCMPMILFHVAAFFRGHQYMHVPCCQQKVCMPFLQVDVVEALISAARLIVRWQKVLRNKRYI